MDIAKDLFFAQQALSTLFLVTNKLQMEGDKHLGDITIRQMLAIPSIFHAPNGKATINHVARSLGTSKQNAKQIVAAMEKKNYISTAPSEQDKRAVNITITPDGKRAFQVCSERTDEFLADIFQHFTTEDLETLCGLLQKLYHFNGQKGVEKPKHMNYTTNNADIILRHHPNFAKRRTNAYE